MKRTYCDSCGERCFNSATIIRIEVLHYTQDYKIVGDDDYSPIEICSDCTEKIQALMPNAFKLLVKPEIEYAQVAEERPVHDRRG